MVKTYSAKAADLKPQWYIIDAEGQVLGRLASQIAQILRGKHKPTFTPHLQSGDYVIVINAEKITVTGRRMNQKIYYRHSQYPGGLKQTTLRQTLEGRFPERALQHAVRGMVMHNRLGADIMSHLKIYAGPTHPHQAQKPIPWTGPESLLKKPEPAIPEPAEEKPAETIESESTAAETAETEPVESESTAAETAETEPVESE